jgi:AcrR family transcriptional regulator
MPGDVRERILEATYACVARYGLGKTTVEDAAREARVSRATVYRYFPGGRDQLVSDVVAWETARFFSRLRDAIADAPDLSHLLVDGLLYARRAVDEHEVLQKVLQTEPDRLLPPLTVAANRILVLITGFLSPYLAAEELRPGITVDEAAEYTARIVLSYIGTPGQWDLTDRAQVARLVDQQILTPLCVTADT